ncbi:DUF4391 domain-containing protein [Streptomyces sp. NPDC057699]|uniref:DUF4391 domain-containing protein n=1 Tax=Streptomyces sp. NPDC057699 TaxID=3346220 RepID=UPI0036C70E78
MSDSTVGVLYQWPPAARFDRRVPKEKFYKHGSVPPALREKFVAEVQRITWAYKLAEATINLAGDAAIPEVQIFHIEAKDDDVSEPVLTAIDKAVRTPIIFEITRVSDRSVRMAAAHKQAITSAPKLSKHHTTLWQTAGTERSPLPTAITLPALYTALLESLIPVTVRPGEAVSVVSARMEAIQKLEREIATLERKLRTEPQFNRKVELRRTLKTKQAELEQQR